MPITNATATATSINARVSRLSDQRPNRPSPKKPIPARTAIRHPAATPAIATAVKSTPTKVMWLNSVTTLLMLDAAPD